MHFQYCNIVRAIIKHIRRLYGNRLIRTILLLAVIYSQCPIPALCRVWRNEATRVVADLINESERQLYVLICSKSERAEDINNSIKLSNEEAAKFRVVVGTFASHFSVR